MAQHWSRLGQKKEWLTLAVIRFEPDGPLVLGSGTVMGSGRSFVLRAGQPFGSVVQAIKPLLDAADRAGNKRSLIVFDAGDKNERFKIGFGVFLKEDRVFLTADVFHAEDPRARVAHDWETAGLSIPAGSPAWQALQLWPVDHILDAFNHAVGRTGHLATQAVFSALAGRTRRASVEEAPALNTLLGVASLDLPDIRAQQIENVRCVTDNEILAGLRLTAFDRSYTHRQDIWVPHREILEAFAFVAKRWPTRQDFKTFFPKTKLTLVAPTDFGDPWPRAKLDSPGLSPETDR